MDLFSFISLFGGLALFLYGMRIMGGGLTQSSSKAFKNALEKITNNPVISFLVGVVITAVIQSSKATIVITSGLVAAGMLTLRQSLGIVLGANVGTTVTGQIIRLMDIDGSGSSVLTFFKPSTLAPLASIIGILMIMTFKFKSSDKVGQIAIGFGILFTGLMNMTAAVEPLSESPTFANMFMNIADKPILGAIVGGVAAFVIQSSSATIGILQALSTTGQLTLSSVYPIVIGIYFGECLTTAIVCSISSKVDARRVGMVHVLFNTAEVILIAIVMVVLKAMGILDAAWMQPMTSGSIANLHTIYKLAGAVVLLPFTGLLEKGSKLLVKDKGLGAELSVYAEDKLLDVAFYRTPSIAFSSASSTINSMAAAAEHNFQRAIGMLMNFDSKEIPGLEDSENFIDHMTDRVSDYLIKLAPYVDAHGNEIVNYNIKCAEEFERIGDLAKNLADNAVVLNNKNTDLSPSAKAELAIVADMISEVITLGKRAFASRDIVAARQIEPLEEAVDEVCEYLRNHHVDRLKNGQCSALAGSTFLDMLVNIERISDQCSNIGVHTVSLYDPKVANAQHEYLNSLHRGTDEDFNAQYKKAKDLYILRLQQVSWDNN